MKQEKYDMKKLIKNKPKYNLDHIIKERYPRFVDALNDIDDAMCLINLFSNLPKHELLNIKSDTVSMCQRLTKEFYLYCAITQAFKKGFISIKGIYLNTEILGQSITWLSPFNYPQKLTFEVDYDIMTNFLELYTNLMKFVNFKLFKDIGLDYPAPQENSDLPFFGFNSLEIRSLQEKINSKASKENENVRKLFKLSFLASQRNQLRQ
jgi:pescadillo protein